MSVLLKADVLDYECGEVVVRLADDTVVEIFVEDVVVSEMYMITMLCFEPKGISYIDFPIDNPIFTNKDDAYAYAMELADNEVENLNSDCVDGVSFGIVEEDNSVCVKYYYHENEYDTTGNTEQVTNYIIKTLEVR